MSTGGSCLGACALLVLVVTVYCILFVCFYFEHVLSSCSFGPWVWQTKKMMVLMVVMMIVFFSSPSFHPLRPHLHVLLPAVPPAAEPAAGATLAPGGASAQPPWPQRRAAGTLLRGLPPLGSRRLGAHLRRVGASVHAMECVCVFLWSVCGGGVYVDIHKVYLYSLCIFVHFTLECLLKILNE